MKIRYLIYILIINSCVNLKVYSQQKILIESVNLKKINYNITLDSIIKVYEWLGTEETFSFTKKDYGVECYNGTSSVLYTVSKDKIKLYYISLSIDTNDIISTIKDNYGMLKPKTLKFYSIYDIYYGLRHLKYIAQKEAIINDSLQSSIKNLIPKDFAYATIINTEKNIETMVNGYENYNMFTKDYKICPECKVVDTLDVAENKLFINDYLSLNCMTVPIPASLCDCYPQDAIAYYNTKNETIAYIEICFDCGTIYIRDLISGKDKKFYLRELKEMNDLLVFNSMNTKTKISPELQRLIHRRIIKNENDRIEDYKSRFEEKGLFFIR